MAVTKTDILFLLAGILQSIAGKITAEMVLTYEDDYGNHSIYINGTTEDYFFYEDYYDVTSTYDYINNRSTNYSQHEIVVEKEKTSSNSASILLPCPWLFSFMTFPHFLYFLREEVYMSFFRRYIALW
ncbi:hypothetical protein JRQ81_009174 [Phrynocephalus forsythii]|uniref:Uncharacterized protein n=1 Tax=Phrynocephalus forsythii TaxID=171643 RepID=A0A9Q0X9W8_9SAUR|nr:hypothetical protein JRQ81_009174 [Phrynocephalus forsythii]